jgi:hypothetical protein
MTYDQDEAFMAAWKIKQDEGFIYGHHSLENVYVGWVMAQQPDPNHTIAIEALQTISQGEVDWSHKPADEMRDIASNALVEMGIVR